MRRTLGILAVAAVLVGGAVYPYAHLVLVPHHYCAVHGTFERSRHRPAHSHDPSGRDDGHDRCVAAAFLGGAVALDAAFVPTVESAALAEVRPETAKRAPFSHKRLLSEAPKLSPPA